MHRVLSLAVLATLIAALLGTISSQPALAQTSGPAWQPPPSTGDCRFGTTFSNAPAFPDSITRYDLALLGIGNYLDWQYQKPPSVPGFIKYIEDLPTSDQYFPSALANIPNALAANPGATWIIGNEPEDRGQEHITPETYAERFYQYATQIRLLDPSAKITFGTIVSPTPLRLMYLDFAWTRLIQLAGTQAKASGLIDIWSPHNFILNEEGGVDANGNPYWGMGIPWGFETRLQPSVWQSLQQTIPLDQLPAALYDQVRFKDRIIAFRQWLKSKGEQNKPVWVTEFGQLAPPMTTPQDNYWTVPDSTTANFMNSLMDWFLTTKDNTNGMPGDQNRLVQKWFWFSINHNRYQFGGTLVDPTTLQQTPVGYALFNYVPPAGSIVIPQPDVYPLSVTSQFLGLNPANRNQASYKLRIRIRNAIISDNFVDVQVTTKVGTTTVASDTGRTARCGGDAVFTYALNNIALTPQRSICVEVHPTSLTDANTSNNTLCIQLQNNFMYLPVMQNN